MSATNTFLGNRFCLGLGALALVSAQACFAKEASEGLEGERSDLTELSEAGQAGIVGFAQALVKQGTNGADTLNGTNSADTLSGLGGNDLINGERGDDTLSGGPGNDRINGSRGDDRINGGPGNDRLSGGSNTDIYTFTGNFGNDIVFETSGNKDILSFPQINFADAKASRKGSNIVITTPNGTVELVNQAIENCKETSRDISRIEGIRFKDGQAQINRNPPSLFRVNSIKKSNCIRTIEVRVDPTDDNNIGVDINL